MFGSKTYMEQRKRLRDQISQAGPKIKAWICHHYRTRDLFHPRAD